MKTLVRIAAVLLAISCSEPAAVDKPLTIEPGGAARTLRIGSREQLSVNAANVVWTSSDTTIARINASAELQLATSYAACKWEYPGNCKVEITARAGNSVATQIITVMPYEPTMEINALQIDLDMGDTARIQASVILETVQVPWCSLEFAARDSAVAVVDAVSGLVAAGDSGSTTIEVRATGPLCPAYPGQVTVNTRSRLHTLTIEPAMYIVLPPGSGLQLSAIVRNWKGVMYPAVVRSWESADTTIASVDAKGAVRAHLCYAGPLVCRTTLTVRSGRLTATATVVVSEQ